VSFAQQACVADTDCPSDQEAMYCKRSSCSVKTGICTSVPDFCSSHFDPVCSCSNFTYANECLAAGAKANIAYKGECSKELGCFNNSDCPGSQFCEKDLGSCVDVGFCSPKPTSCPPEVVPVCGCDGNSYKSECAANQGGFSVDYGSACVPFVSCGMTSDCPKFYFCKQPLGACVTEAVAISGRCSPVPVNCSTQYDPVCGCDKHTYPNGCFADFAGVSIATVGECSNVQECSSDSDCASTEICQKDVGVCGDFTIAGECFEKPMACNFIFAPVCGCDNATYVNDCVAYSKGVNLATNSACN